VVRSLLWSFREECPPPPPPARGYFLPRGSTAALFRTRFSLPCQRAADSHFSRRLFDLRSFFSFAAERRPSPPFFFLSLVPLFPHSKSVFFGGPASFPPARLTAGSQGKESHFSFSVRRSGYPSSVWHLAPLSLLPPPIFFGVRRRNRSFYSPFFLKKQVASLLTSSKRRRILPSYAFVAIPSLSYTRSSFFFC